MSASAPARGATARPDRYAVLGNPVEHSLSPTIHAMFARATGQAIEYERRLCPLDGFERELRALAASGARGCNVTVPFKFDAARLVGRLSERAALAQAANTIGFDAEGWWADNTDGVGLVTDIERNAQVALAGRRVLLVGAGGAAAGVLGPLLERAPHCVVVANRTPDRARDLVARHRVAAGAVDLRGCGLDDTGSGFDVVLNASASSLSGSGLLLDPRVLRPGALALDLMYGPAAHGFLRWAEQHGAIARDGLGMLVEQAAEAFHLWRGVRPDTAPVLAALRAQLDRA